MVGRITPGFTQNLGHMRPEHEINISWPDSLPNVSLGAADAGANIPLEHSQVCIVEAAEASGDVVEALKSAL